MNFWSSSSSRIFSDLQATKEDKVSCQPQWKCKDTKWYSRQKSPTIKQQVKNLKFVKERVTLVRLQSGYKVLSNKAQ
jgi:hypothetical protein